MLAALAALSLCAPTAQAQVAAAAAPAKPAPETPVPVEKKATVAPVKGEVITLDPFTVNAEKDNGFMATNAGTATKLGIDLKDLAAPYSVMTGEFIKALGITNIETAAIWATNGAPVLDGQGADIFNANGGARINNATTMYFARGVIMNAGQQRNFFLNAGTNDAYNVDRIDFGRGPNAVLFNVGASNVLGGGISTLGKRARVDRDFNTLTFTTGSWNYNRSTLDVNKVLTDDLALRANLIWQKRGGWQAGEQDDRTGVTLAGAWRLKNRSELNIEVRHDKLSRSRPATPFGDNLSGWDGKTVFNGPISDFQIDGKTTLTGTSQTLQTLPSGSSAQGQLEGVWRSGDAYVYDPASGTVMNWLHTGSTRRGDETSWTPIYFNGVQWTRNGNNDILPIGNYGATGGNSRTPSPTSNGGDAAFTDMTNLPDDRFSKQMAGSRFTIPGRRDSVLPKTPLYREDTKGANVNFIHQFSDSLVLEVQVDANRVDMNQVAPPPVLNQRNLLIDLNRNLPNGQTNPHFLDAYGQSTVERGFRRTDNAGIRAALGYSKDFGKWGNYTFNLSAIATARDVDWRRYIYTLNLGADARDWHSYPMLVRYYQHDTDRSFYLPNAPTTLFNRTTVAGASGSDNTYTTALNPIAPSWTLTAFEKRRERNKSATFAFAGRWFDNKLIISPGIRAGLQDTSLRWTKSYQGWGFLPANWDGVMVNDSLFRPDAPADWKTLTFTPRNAAGVPLTSAPILSGWRARPTTLVAGTRDVWAPNPLYVNGQDRFRDDYNRPAVKNKVDVNTTVGATYHLFDWAALKLSYGTSFLPPDVGRFTLDDSDAKAETGIAYETAITFSLFNNKLSITPRHYFNRRENVLTGSPSGGAINNLVDIRAWDETSPVRGNKYGYPGIYGSDYFAQYNDGYELEVGGELVKGWRLSASYGTAQIVDYDRFPLTQPYIQARKDEFKQILEAAGGMIDTTRKPLNGSRSVDAAPGLAIANPAITDAMITAVTLIDGSNGSPQKRTDAVNAYNNIWVGYDQINTQTKFYSLRRLSAKLVTDYTVQTGKLKGFRYGVAIYYVDRDLAGYRSGDTIPNPNYNTSLPITSTNRQWVDDPSVDNATPIWVKRPFEVTALFGYTHRLHTHGRLDGKELEFQLNIKNVLNSHDIYYQDDGVTLRPPNGDINAPNRVAVPGRIASYQRPINYEFTTTLKF